MRTGLVIGAIALIGGGSIELPGTARAASTDLPSGPAPDGDTASSLAGLFLQSCVHFIGDRQALRAWAQKTGLHELPAAGEQQFLYGLPGQVFDASDTHGKFVLVSEDSGSCSVLAEKVNGDVPMGARRKIREAFQEGRLDVIVAHPGAMGTGFSGSAMSTTVAWNMGPSQL